jgi:hypothetical protein
VLYCGDSRGGGCTCTAALRVARVRVVQLVDNCSVFYEPYRIRGIGWGSGPGLGVGFGTFVGALRQYPVNSFPQLVWRVSQVGTLHFDGK